MQSGFRFVLEHSTDCANRLFLLLRPEHRLKRACDRRSLLKSTRNLEMRSKYTFTFLF